MPLSMIFVWMLFIVLIAAIVVGLATALVARRTHARALAAARAAEAVPGTEA